MKKAWVTLIVLVLALWMGTAKVLADGICQHPEEARRWEHDETRHWQVCTLCGGEGWFGEGTLHVAYCNSTATDVCDLCGATGVILDTVDEKLHPESALVWEYDDYYHRQVCTLCGDVAYSGQHMVRCDAPNVCDLCGATGIESPEDSDLIIHQEEAWSYDDNVHWRACSLCGDYYSEKHHDYCYAPGVCAECGATDVNCAWSEHSTDTMMDAYDDTSCWYVCSMCGETLPGWHIKHSRYCNEPMCYYCGAKDVTFDFVDHPRDAWKLAYNDEIHWYYCSLCGEDFDAGEDHFFDYVAYDDAQHAYRCEACEYVKGLEPHSTKEGDPAGICSFCGTAYQKTPATVEPTPTLTPTAPPESTPTAIPDVTAEPLPEAIFDESLGKLITPDNLTYTGFASFESGKFYIENGQQKTDFIGPVQVDGTFYAFDHGRLQTENMMMAFEGGLFAFNGGTLRTDLIGLAAYDGEQFVFDHGQYQRQASGPYLDPISGKWVYVNEGQFYPITDLVSYDGEIFYFVDGFLATGYTGIVYDFNGTGFYIASGQHYKITDLVSCNGEVLYVVDGKFASWYTGVVKDFQGAELNVVSGKVVQ